LRLLASRTLTLQFALGFLTVGWLDTLVLAIKFLANRAAFGFRSRAGGVALSGSADSFALRAGTLLAIILGATNGANRTFAVYGTFSAGDFFASHFASRTRADRVADSRALRIIALPAALGVALLSRSNSSQG